MKFTTQAKAVVRQVARGLLIAAAVGAILYVAVNLTLQP